MHKIQNYNDDVIKDYNNSFNSIVENIRDFIVLHYLTKRKDTEFWKNILNTEIPESLKNNIEKWKIKMPIREDFKNTSSYAMFWQSNFITVMSGLNLFNKKAILNEYGFLSDNVKNYAINTVNQEINIENSTKYITHKEILKIIRDIN